MKSMLKKKSSSNYFLQPQFLRFLKIALLLFLVILVSILAWRPINYLSGTPAHYDSGVFASGGFFLLEGKVLYKDFWDHKPPVVHFLNAAALALGHRDINSIRTMERCFAVFAAVSLFFIVYLLFRNMWLSLFASVFYIIHFFRPVIFDDGNFTEEYGAAFVMGGILFVVLSNETKRFSYILNFISGMFFSTAFFTKEPFLLSAIPWFIYLIIYKDRNRMNVLKRASVFIGGAVLIFAVILFYLISHNAFKDWIDVLSFNCIYTSMSNKNLTVFMRIFKNFEWAYSKLFGTTLTLSLFALTGFITVFYWRFVKKYKYLHLVVISFFVLDFYATMMAARGYRHYYMQLVTSYILISVIGVEFLLSILKKSKVTRIGIISIIILLSFGIDKPMYVGFKDALMTPAAKTPAGKLVEYIKAHSSPKDTIWMTCGTFSRYYMMCQRLSPTKYYYIADHLFINTYSNTSKEKTESVKDDLKRNPPKFIITKDFEEVNFIRDAKIQDWIKENYYKAAETNPKYAVILELKQPAEPHPK